MRTRLTVVVIVAVLIAAGCDWSQFHWAGRNGDGSIAPAQISDVRLEWSAETGGPVESSPAIVFHRVFVGSNDHSVRAYDAASGAPLWDTTTNGAVTSSPAVAGQNVIVGSDDGAVRAFDTQTGMLRWTTTTGGSIHSSAYAWDSRVFVGSADGNVYALDSVTGAELWHANVGSAVDASPVMGPTSTLLQADGAIFVGANDGRLYAFASDGTPLWNAPTGGPIHSSPAVAQGRVLVGSDDGNLYAFDAASGELLWRAPTGGAITSSPAVSNGVAYVGSMDHLLYAFDVTSGAKQWSVTTGGPIDSSPAVANNVIYIGSTDGSLYAYATSGSPLTSIATGGPIHSSPAVANGSVYVGSDDHRLYAFGTDLFEPSVQYEVGSKPMGVAVDDFDGNGRSDVAITYGGGETVSVLLSNPDGTLRAPAGYPVGVPAGGIATGEFDHDGARDIVVIEPGGIGVFHNLGDGTFAAVQRYDAGPWPYVPVTGDFNGDGWDDIAVSDYQDPHVYVFLNRHDGTFAPHVDSLAGAGARAVGLVTADFDGDGVLDLAVSGDAFGFGSGGVTLLHGNGDGTFAVAQRYELPTLRIATADMNGDGRADIVAGLTTDRIAVFLNTGVPGAWLTTPFISSTGGYTHADIAVADITGHGNTDVISASSGNLAFYRNDGTGRLDRPRLYPVPFGAAGVGTGDFNRDGRPDVAMTDFDGTTVSVLIHR